MITKSDIGQKVIVYLRNEDNDKFYGTLVGLKGKVATVSRGTSEKEVPASEVITSTPTSTITVSNSPTGELPPGAMTAEDYNEATRTLFGDDVPAGELRKVTAKPKARKIQSHPKGTPAKRKKARAAANVLTEYKFKTPDRKNYRRFGEFKTEAEARKALREKLGMGKLPKGTEVIPA